MNYTLIFTHKNQTNEGRYGIFSLLANAKKKVIFKTSLPAFEASADNSSRTIAANRERGTEDEATFEA